MTTNAITDLYYGVEELFSSSSRLFETLPRQVTDTILSLPNFPAGSWAAIGTTCKIASSCYQLAQGTYNGIKAYREISVLNAQVNLPQNPIESEHRDQILQDRKLVIISSLFSFLHIPNLLHERPGSNSWSALQGLIARSINVIKNSKPGPSDMPSPPSLQRFLLGTDLICITATAVFLSQEMGYIANKNLLAQYALYMGTISSSAQIPITVQKIIAYLIDKGTIIDLTAHA
jgi:hypothetical protein